MKLSQAKEYLPFVQAAAEGKIIQHKTPGLYDWKDCDPQIGYFEDNDNDHIVFRIKPEPKLRPWKPEEVPVGCLVCQKNRDSIYNKYVLISLNGESVNFGRYGECASMQHLLDMMEHSTDHGKTWLPCGILE